MPWIYQTSEGPQGPISDEELKRLVADGTIYEQTPIKKAGSNSDFVPAWNIKGLKFPELYTPPEPPKAPENYFAPSPPAMAKPAAVAPQVKMQPTLGKYYTPSFLGLVWTLSIIGYVIVVVSSIAMFVVSKGEALPLALGLIVGGAISLISTRITLECVAVIFDISNYLKHIANK